MKQENTFLVEVPELNRQLALTQGIMNPQQTSTKPFLNLITNLDLVDKNVLDLGCGSGALSILAARGGAKVVAVDIEKKAIEITKLNLSNEARETQKNVIIVASNLYSNIEKTTNSPDLKFDFVFFNNPLIAGESPHSTTSVDSFAGKNFEVIIRALIDLPLVIKPNGHAYFLVIDSKISLPGIWTVEHLKKFLPQGWSCNRASELVEIDKDIGLFCCLFSVANQNGF